MHPGEVDIDGGLVRRLVAAQFPTWAGQPVERVASAGTDNALYRLGSEFVVRLPRTSAAAGQIEKERRWLPVLRPQLPLEVPVLLGNGEPGEGYPWRWSVLHWLTGDSALSAVISDPLAAAEALGGFVVALRSLDPAGGPRPGAHNFFRGVPLRLRDAHVRAAIDELSGTLEPSEVSAAWQLALRAAEWDRPPVWIHGDLLPTNLLVTRGKLSAVIDFGGLGVGDPACDVMAAWAVFTGESRATFRAALGVDDDTWARGRGWALSFALIALPYYEETNRVLADLARRTIAEVLTDG
jgi:aminoglycoside phosphotransferase (APT) family kinase protein